MACGLSLLAETGYSLIAVCRLLIAVASLVAVHGLQRAGSVVVAFRLRCPVTCGIFPDSGIEPVFPALQGRFLTTEPPGKPHKIL